VDGSLEGAALRFESRNGEAAEAAGAFCGAEGPGGFEGIADGGDFTGAGSGEQGSQDSGEEVGVLVRVDVGDAEAGGLQAADLGSGLGDNFRCANTEGEEVGDEAGERGPEGLAVGAERGDLFGG